MRATLGPLVFVWFRSTMSLSRYYWCYQYHESMSIPWVHVYAMGPCLYHKYMSIPWVNVYTISPYLCHESMYIPWVVVNITCPCSYHDSWPITWPNVYTISPEISITDIQKSKLLTKTEEEKKIYTFQKYK